MIETCTHCGRSNCHKLGSLGCNRAREKWFERQRRYIEEMAKMQKSKSPTSGERS